MIKESLPYQGIARRTLFHNIDNNAVYEKDIDVSSVTLEEKESVGSNKMQEQNVAEVIQTEIKYPILNIEEPEYCKLSVSYEGDPRVVSDKRDEAIAYFRKAKVSGFRKGRADDNVVRIAFRKEIDTYIINEMLRHAFDDIVFETNIKAIGQPSYDEMKLKNNKFSCNMVIYKKPAFDLKQYQGFEIPEPHLDVTEGIITERSLMNLRMRLANLVPFTAEDVVEMGDQVTISYFNTEFPENKTESETYGVGSNAKYGTLFDECLLGMMTGETKEFDVSLEDKSTIRLSVTFHMGTKVKAHPIDEDFYNKVGVKDLDDLMAKLSAISASKVVKMRQDQIRQQIAHRLVDGHEIQLPDFILKDEYKNILTRYNLTEETATEEQKTDVMKMATTNIKLSLILDSIREVEPESVLNDEEAQQSLIKYIQDSGQDPKEVFNNPETRAQLGFMLSSIKDEFVLQWLCQ